MQLLIFLFWMLLIKFQSEQQMFAGAVKTVSQSSLENKNKESNYRFPTFITDKHVWGIRVDERQVDFALCN